MWAGNMSRVQFALDIRAGGRRDVKGSLKEAWMEAYCVKCKAKREMKDAKQVKMKNGRAAMKGRCPTCGTGLYRIMSS